MVLRSLQWRLIIIFIFITFSLMVLVGVFLNRSVESTYYELFTSDLELAFQGAGLYPDTQISFEKLTEKLEGRDFFQMKGEYRSYTILDKDTSKILSSSDKRFTRDEQKYKDEISRSDNLVSAFAGFVGRKEKLNKNSEAAFLDYAYPVGQYVLYFRLDSGEWSKTVRRFNEGILKSGGLSILISLIIAFILSRYISEPLKRIMAKAQRIAEGDFDYNLTANSGDEIGNLTDTFNYMAGELKNKLGEISSEKNKLETILNYMTDGVIAYNLKGEAIHANPAFYKIMQADAVNYSFNEFAEKYNLDISLEDILYLKDCNVKEKFVNINDKAIRVYFAVFTDEEKNPEGLIAVFQDITEQQKLDNMRREFVANVSHELRTPLTSIKSYSETLIDGAIEDKETAIKFLGVINSEADRMTRLVKDLLQLTKLDNKQTLWRMEDISLVPLVRSCIERHQIEATNKKQTIESYVIGEIPEIQADRDRIEQVIINILTNAIKYTDTEGKITVYIGKTQNYVYVKFSDNGIGIPKEDLPRICERFYRVDKARSREMGGTGLGLAIVKEIVEGHGGFIDIESEYGKGTDVTVKLPICNSFLNAV